MHVCIGRNCNGETVQCKAENGNLYIVLPDNSSSHCDFCPFCGYSIPSNSGYVDHIIYLLDKANLSFDIYSK